MRRCRKLYFSIEQLATAFKLIQMRAKVLNVKPVDPEKKLKFNKRIISVVKTFVSENIAVPRKFIFGGNDLISLLQ